LKYRGVSRCAVRPQPHDCRTMVGP